ncbi:hypothetical protein PHMEG_00032891, partial [Phytophthora megakarya]
MLVIAFKADGNSDYHGSFTGGIFELWFEDLCNERKCRYGPFRILVDGAVYHKFVGDPAPSSAKSMAFMEQWLHGHG